MKENIRKTQAWSPKLEEKTLRLCGFAREKEEDRRPETIKRNSTVIEYNPLNAGTPGLAIRAAGTVFNN